MKKGIVILIIILSFSGKYILSQSIQILAKNIYYQNIMEDGTLSENKTIYNQKTYNNKIQLIIDRDYDKTSGDQKYYTLFFYDTIGKVKSIEKYDMMEKPIDLKMIIYNYNGDTLKILQIVRDSDSALTNKEKKFYYSNGLLKKIYTFSSNNKIEEIINYVYKSKITNKPNKIMIINKTDYPFKAKVNYIYTDSTGLIISSKTFIKKGIPKQNILILRKYNKKGNIIEEKYLEDNKLSYIRKYKYSADIELNEIVEENSKGIKTGFYSSNYFWHEISFLNIKSYFEDK